MNTALKLDAPAHQTEDEDTVYEATEFPRIGAVAYYDEYAGPGTFRHLDLLYRADCKGKPDHVRLKFEDESDINKFFDWLASAFDTPVLVDLFKHMEESDTLFHIP